MAIIILLIMIVSSFGAIGVNNQDNSCGSISNDKTYTSSDYQPKHATGIIGFFEDNDPTDNFGFEGGSSIIF